MKDPGGRTDQLELGKERERQMCINVYANGNVERDRDSRMCVRDGVMKGKRRRDRERERRKVEKEEGEGWLDF